VIKRSAPIATPLSAWANCVVYATALALLGLAILAGAFFVVTIAAVVTSPIFLGLLVVFVAAFGFVVGNVVGVITAALLAIGNRAQAQRWAARAIPLVALVVTAAACYVAAGRVIGSTIVYLLFGVPLSLLGGRDIAKRYRASVSPTPVGAG
jgi:hypothetical protein